MQLTGAEIICECLLEQGVTQEQQAKQALL